jgi:hypothetical protein
VQGYVVDDADDVLFVVGGSDANSFEQYSRHEVVRSRLSSLHVATGSLLVSRDWPNVRGSDDRWFRSSIRRMIKCCGHSCRIPEVVHATNSQYYLSPITMIFHEIGFEPLHKSN